MLPKKDHIFALGLGLIWTILLCMFALKSTTVKSIQQFISPITTALQPLRPLKEAKAGKEIFGFLPNWNLDKANSIDFKVLTTLAYFDIKANENGEIIKDDAGYTAFKSKKATDIFKTAHANGTRVVATITMMDANQIVTFLDNPEAQHKLVNDTVSMVQKRGVDGVNLDVEYFGEASAEYKPKFTAFVAEMTTKMHHAMPSSQVSVSLDASVVTSPRIYDLAALAHKSDLIFMMAYDFATVTSDYAIPTAPLYGHASGKFWYDVSTAVKDFLTKMPAKKLVLGNPYYNLSFPVVEPEMKAATTSAWTGGAKTVTYANQKELATNSIQGATQVLKGWDEDAKVGWVAYYHPESGWRMNFLEDTRSLAAKYDFAINKNLAGVGFWALGNDGDSQELWDLIKEKFGAKLADNTVIHKSIDDEDHI